MPLYRPTLSQFITLRLGQSSSPARQLLEMLIRAFGAGSFDRFGATGTRFMAIFFTIGVTNPCVDICLAGCVSCSRLQPADLCFTIYRSAGGCA